jgi:hypothetical protein
VPIGVPNVCGKTRSPKIIDMLSIKNSSMLMISVSENFLEESDWCFFHKIISVLSKHNVFVSTMTILFYETQLSFYYFIT